MAGKGEGHDYVAGWALFVDAESVGMSGRGLSVMPGVSYVGSVRIRGNRAALGARYLAKRIGDVVASALLILLLLPLLIVTALAIKIDTRGPVLFKQDRIGSRRNVGKIDVQWRARTFQIYKFRSMVHGADEALHREYTQTFVNGTAEEATEERSGFKLNRDPRVTRVGRVIRRTSFDEVPQLLNVLLGDMSLVGPRPVPIYEVEDYDVAQMERLHALPGITGYWQVHGRGVVPFEEMMEMDLFYVRNQSLWLDFKLLLLTLPAVVAGRGAE